MNKNKLIFIVLILILIAVSAKAMQNSKSKVVHLQINNYYYIDNNPKTSYKIEKVEGNHTTIGDNTKVLNMAEKKENKKKTKNAKI